MIKFNDWFSCPICGDEGKVVKAIAGGADANIEFKCMNESHRADRGDFSRYQKQEWTHEENHLLSLFGEDALDQRFGELSACVKCPYCDSSNATGALSVTGYPESTSQEGVGVFCVWCWDCEETEKSILSHDITHDSKDINMNLTPKMVR